VGVHHVRLGDGVSGLLSLAPGSASLVLSDLPSGETRAPFDRAPDLSALWPAIWRALGPGGTAALMASNLRFAARLLASQPDAFRYDLVWHKSLGGGFLNAKRRPLRAHEYVLVFWRGDQAHYSPQMRGGHKPINATPAGRWDSGANYGATGTGAGRSRAGATDRYPCSVLQIRSLGTVHPHRRHPQQKPVDLMRWLVRTYSAPGDLVVDPYAGSGSAGEACRLEERAFAGWDSDPRFGGLPRGEARRRYLLAVGSRDPTAASE
jgi:hypothetical protein